MDFSTLSNISFFVIFTSKKCICNVTPPLINQGTKYHSSNLFALIIHFFVLNILLFIVRCFTESASGKSSSFYWFCLLYSDVFTVSKQLFCFCYLVNVGEILFFAFFFYRLATPGESSTHSEIKMVGIAVIFAIINLFTGSKNCLPFELNNENFTVFFANTSIFFVLGVD